MVVISDTSPLNYLILIDEIELLPKLFGTILIPPSVLSELQRNEAPIEVKNWLITDPKWLKIRTASVIDSTIALGTGESEAISLALEINADIVLIDDKKVRQAAVERKLKVAGTLNILELAAIKKILDLSSAFEKLRQTNFRVSQDLLDEALERVKNIEEKLKK